MKLSGRKSKRSRIKARRQDARRARRRLKRLPKVKSRRQAAALLRHRRRTLEARRLKSLSSYQMARGRLTDVMP